MKGKRPKPTTNERFAITTEENPDVDSFVPEGMIRLTVRESMVGEIERWELLAPAGHPVYPTLIGVDHITVAKAGGREIVGTVHWATPEAVAISAEVYAEKVARREVPYWEAGSTEPDLTEELP